MEKKKNIKILLYGNGQLVRRELERLQTVFNGASLAVKNARGSGVVWVGSTGRIFLPSFEDNEM